MKLLSKIALTVALVAGMSAAAQAQISYTGGTYTQDFDSIAEWPRTMRPVADGISMWHRHGQF